MKASSILVSLIGVATATVRPPPGCAYDKCFWKDQIPQEWKPLVTKFCKALIGKQPCSTPSARFSTVVNTLSPTTVQQTLPQSTVVETVQYTTTVVDSVEVTNTQTQGTLCVVTTDGQTPVTSITYPRFTNPASNQPQARDLDELAAQDDPQYRNRMKRDTLPAFATAGCNKSPPLQKLKDACKCFLASPESPIKTTTIVQAGSTVIQTLPAQTTTVIETLPQQTVRVTSTNVVTATVQSCTSTSTVYSSTIAISSCGAPPGTYVSRTIGQISCTQPAAAPSGSVNAFHRIEADNNQGTVFEGCIYAGPRSITTPSGGTHQCGASTGTSITGQTDAASQLTGFTYDGTFSPSFNDYFITRIGSTQQSGNSYWGVLNNGVFTTSGGCGAQVRAGDSSLWQWDAFNLNQLLTIAPQYAVVSVGSTVSITVTGRSPNGGPSSPFQGATLSGGQGLQSGSDGGITFTVPSEPGCYQYKASAGGSGRSNAFYLNVVSQFPSEIK
ncbi:hypothetical protein EJ05DRAFT_509351 [Pseudovirgaria hyperparasitica]|uniref:Uncharacterized protein n=1 Tax=Pseudovirgaria hyperparasitica TaxID=470096 RepID=A0A6A6WBS7_9PEZI|nr:uncharacterized protein EJ05DRAFT_509351 [Pseudovirgaria hyperparasitica]KAF2759619.1 hypothetical protein EJ05DRAFT_509351 [Pseudovirgaria hyperparasitica]